MKTTPRLTSTVVFVMAVLALTACPRRKPDQRPTTQTPKQPAATETVRAPATEGSLKVPTPPKGCLYHGVHPGGEGGEEDVAIKDPKVIDSYARAAGRQPAFVYFSHEWGHEDDRDEDVRAHAFPLEKIREIARGGRIPFIRLMLRTSSDAACDSQEKYFTLENILGTNPRDRRQRQISAEINADLREWGRVAREEYKGPLIVEWGTEANNLTFHWNPHCRGGDKRAAVALFRKAFRHVVRTVSGPEPEKTNLTWVFHVTATSDPDPAESKKYDWNRMADYYPDGTKEDPIDVVDWLGVSVYGADDLDSGDCQTFSEQLKTALGKPDGKGPDEGLLALSTRTGPQKPIYVLEFGTALNYEVAEPKAHCQPETWIREAFVEMFSRAGEGVLSGFSWWNERFEGGGENRKTLEMRFDHLPIDPANEAKTKAILEAYRASLNDPRVVHASPEGGRPPSPCEVVK